MSKKVKLELTERQYRDLRWCLQVALDDRIGFLEGCSGDTGDDVKHGEGGIKTVRRVMKAVNAAPYIETIKGESRPLSEIMEENKDKPSQPFKAPRITYE